MWLCFVTGSNPKVLRKCQLSEKVNRRRLANGRSPKTGCKAEFT